MPARAAPRTTEPTTSTLSAGGGAAEGHRRTRLDRPEGELGDGHEPGREESRGGIEALADEGCAVADAEQRETYRHHRSPPEDEAAGEKRQPGEHSHRRRAGIVARGQANGEREERRAHRGPRCRPLRAHRPGVTPECRHLLQHGLQGVAVAPLDDGNAETAETAAHGGAAQLPDPVRQLRLLAARQRG